MQDICRSYHETSERWWLCDTNCRCISGV